MATDKVSTVHSPSTEVTESYVSPRIDFILIGAIMTTIAVVAASVIVL